MTRKNLVRHFSLFSYDGVISKREKIKKEIMMKKRMEQEGEVEKEEEAKYRRRRRQRRK